MTQTIASPDPLLINILVGALAIGLPILMVLAMRFLWDRNVQLGRSKELEKLIWQLHRIATALEHQMNLSFPAVQPGTEEPRDVAFLKPVATQPGSAVPAASGAAAVAPASNPPALQQPATLPAAEQPSLQTQLLREPSAEELPRRAGVNSMFGL